MNGNTQGRGNESRAARTYTLAPTTRAIRAALFGSMALLGFAGSGVALAGTCVTDTTANTATCNGDFSNLPGGNFVPAVDLTLILGDSAPTSVTPAAGVIGVDATWGGNVGVITYADITTSGADGIYEYGSATATLTNYGAITTDVTAPGVDAIDISAYGNVTAYNGGAVKAYSTGGNDVTAISAYSLFGTAEVYNKLAGTITATAQDGNAIGIDVSAYGTAEIINVGAVSASSVNGIAIGALDQSSTGRSFFYNEGSIVATSTNGQAVGALVSGDAAYATNLAYTAYFGADSGSITVTSGSDAAIGMEAYGYAYARAKNTGSITVTSNGGTATGVIADSYKGAARITNTGSISATSLYYSPAVGVEAYSAFSGAASVKNYGTISATAVSGSATGIIAQAHYGQVSVVNSGDVSATAGVGTYYQHNRGTGIVASSGAGYSPGITHVTNSGNITASGPTLGEGIVGSARYGDLTITNTATGNIKAYGQNEAIGIGTGQNGHNGFGRYIDGYTSQADIYNAGSITAAADATNCASCSQIEATGIQIFLNQGNNVTVTNSGDIAASVLGGSTTNYSEALGIDAVTYRGDITVNNSGSIAVAANIHGPSPYSEAVYNVGILTNTVYGATSIVNSGDIGINVDGVTSYNDRGIWASTSSNTKALDNGAVSVVNSGNIDVSANNTDPSHYATLIEGIYVLSNTRYGHGPVTVVNSGDINLTATTGGTVYGIEAYVSAYGDFTVANSGNITTKNNTFSFTRYGNTYIVGGVSMGILAKFSSAGGTATVTNSGDINATGGSTAFGIYARYIERTNYFSTGNLAIANSGSITATEDAFGNPQGAYVGAYGIRSNNDDGNTTVTNSGSITATVVADPVGGNYAGARVEGIQINDSSPGQSPAEIAHLVPGYGTISITNSGSITASIKSNGLHYAGGYNASGVGVQHGYGAVDIVNSGAISASAQDDAATATGTIPTTARGLVIAKNVRPSSAVYSQGSETVTNSSTGSITASATSDYADVSTSAIGLFTVLGLSSSSYVSADRANTIDNAGWVSATATVGGADTLGTATATGISAFSWSDGLVSVTNSGNVLATATSPSVATASGLYASASNLVVALNAGGYVGATATGATGTAIGLSLVDAGTTALAASNAGAIKATFNGAGGKAYGANITSAGDVAFTNSGQIVASNTDDAVGVQLNSPTATKLVNSGSITATSSSGNGIALRTGDSIDVIQNTGTMSGALVTAGGDDNLNNNVGGVWNVMGTSTDFGDGDDLITNAGTIHMNNAAISMGSFKQGNQFANAGLIMLVGNNTITMGAGASPNPSPFTNNGTLDFQNGVAGDTLKIVGNFAGNSSINMDVSGLHGTGDQLQIQGDVASGTVNTVNVNVLDDPTAASTIIPLVTVTGTSVAGNFVLGKVVQDKSFLALSDTLLTSIDTSNKTPDVFSLGMTVPPPPPPVISVVVNVNGLSDTGTLAAAIVPGVDSLMNSETGTLRQRVGAISNPAGHGLSLWGRVFSDNGTVNPAHTASNFGQGGNFAFKQDNSGGEVGADFALSDQFSAGLLLGKAQASQHLNGNGVGSTRITGNTVGAYGTWIAPSGFYLDGSYRRMNFDAKVNSAAGETRTKGNADALNGETGYAWILGSGVTVEPQLQYTRTKVNHLDTLAGALTGFTPEGGTSSRGRAGVLVSKSFTANGALWTPYAAVSAVREFDGQNDFSIDNTFFGSTSTKGTSALVEGGLAVQTGKLTVYGGVNWQDGGALKSVLGGQVGVRYTW